MRDEFAGVRIVDGSVVTAPGVGPPALVWLPLNGQVIAKIPPRKGNRGWLHKTLSIRSPQLEDDRWHLPRNCLVKLVTGAVDRFGHAVLWRDVTSLSRCTSMCLDAQGMDCQCSCMGEHHGTNSNLWFELIGSVAVADLGERKRSVAIYGPSQGEADPAVYDGELRDRQYTVKSGERRGWPQASTFVCTACLIARAEVWDHCHTHGFVRAPLCSPCNTRHWSGWKPQHGRATPSRNLDSSYYEWCPEYDPDPDWDPCSA